MQNLAFTGPDRAYRLSALSRLPAFPKNPHHNAELIETGVNKVRMRGRSDRLEELRYIVLLRTGKSGLNSDVKNPTNPANVVVVPVRDDNELDCRRGLDPQVFQVPESYGFTRGRVETRIHDHPVVVGEVANNTLSYAWPEEGDLDLVAAGWFNHVADLVSENRRCSSAASASTLSTARLDHPGSRTKWILETLSFWLPCVL